MKNRLKFTNDSIEKWSDLPDKGKRLYLYDTQERGLGLSVTPAGTKSFFYHGRVNGRSERIPAGRFPEISVDLARSNVLKIRTAIEEGRNPREAVAVARPRRGGVVTLGDFFEIYLEQYAKHHVDGWEKLEEDFKRYHGQLASLPVNGITADAVLFWHRHLGATRGEATANKQANMLRAIFNKAVLWTKPDGTKYAQLNPAAAQLVPRFSEDQRDRFLSADELPRFFKAVAECEIAAARHFFLMALCTGARKSNIMAASFKEIDNTNWIWTVPRAQVKGKRGQRHPLPLPIVTQLQPILNIRREMYGEEWVFPGRRLNGNHIANVTTWWKAILKPSGLDDLRIHDLRRTLASWMAMTGASYPIIAQMLGHTLSGATSIYARLAIEPVREAAQVAVDKMWEVGGVE